MTIKFLLHTTGEALASLCGAGLLAVWLCWRSAKRKDFLVAFAFGDGRHHHPRVRG